MRKMTGPYPTVAFWKQLARDVIAPMQAIFSGECTVGVKSGVVGAAPRGARVSEVWMSVGTIGMDNDNSLQVSGEVYINGVSCLSTRPSIGYVTGEASQQKTTRVTGDTGIVQAAIDMDANTVTDGDMLTFDLDVARTTPDVEISNVVLVVELEPIIG